MADKEDDELASAKEEFTRCEEAESENRTGYESDIRFAKLEEQWPEKIKRDREAAGLPCLTANKLPSFIRQVVNEARQNRPSIRVHPADDVADPATAEVYNGLIRNIEQTSKADVAYDTAVDCAVSGGFGYFRICTDYRDDMSFELDLRIERIADPLSVYGDPFSTQCDSSDWNIAFITEVLSFEAFKAKYPKAERVDWDADYAKLAAPWIEDKSVLVAERWKREKVKKTIVALSDGTVLEKEVYEKQREVLEGQGETVLGERETDGFKITHTVMTGAEILETSEWPGKYIPIVPVYGDEVNLSGKRYFRSLIRSAKDTQRIFNFFRTMSAQVAASVPKVPFIGKKGTFKSDAAKWATINSANHAFIEYDGETPPERQPLDGGRAIGAIQEALNATDDMKAILGIYDASLGAQGNETSGRAIIARQKEGDTSSFHFLDNLSRAIEHGGRILIDLIPKVYSGVRMIRVLGPDYRLAQNIQIGGNAPQYQEGKLSQQPGKPIDIAAICDLSRGKYDLSVETGPAYGTRRQETADQILNMIQAYPPAAPVLGDILAKNLDWPEADEVARRLKALLPPQLQGDSAPQDPMQSPQVQQMVQEGVQHIQQLTQQVQQLSQENQVLQQKNGLEARKLEIEAYKAETDRIQAEKPEPLRAVN